MNSIRNALTGRSSSAGQESEVNELISVGKELKTQFSRKLECGLDDFELGVTLGTGTFGRVRLVEYINHEKVENAQRFYALKCLKKIEVIRLKQVAHIQNEITLLAKIEHPFIVNMVNNFQNESHLFMVLEFVSGGELFTYLRTEGRLNNDESKFFAAQIVLIFGYLHAKDIVYRDLKPENLLIDNVGYLKLADFGFAKTVKQRTWTLCGTPEYLAPEIVQSKGHGKAVDWWAFGVLVYEMLAGYPPFFDENPFGIYQKILAGTVEYPKHMDSKAVQMLKKLLVADISKRLGCLKNGMGDIQKCKWFLKTNWRGIYSKSLKASYLPFTQGEGDPSNFDEYPESPPGSTSNLTAEQDELFQVFDTLGFVESKQ